MNPYKLLICVIIFTFNVYFQFNIPASPDKTTITHLNRITQWFQAQLSFYFMCPVNAYVIQATCQKDTQHIELRFPREFTILFAPYLQQDRCCRNTHVLGNTTRYSAHASTEEMHFHAKTHRLKDYFEKWFANRIGSYHTCCTPYCM